jgi:hypothetical protein
MNTNKWNDLGFAPDVAHEWHAAGFTPDEAKRWSEYFAPEVAARWREHDFTPKEAYSWAETGRVLLVRSGWREEDLEGYKIMALEHQRKEIQ